LEAIVSRLGVSLDWLFSDSKIIDLIEINKDCRNKDLICLYAFTQEELNCGEQMLRDLLGQRRYIFVDATGKSESQIIRELVGVLEKGWEAYRKLEAILLHEEIIVVIKNISKSEMPYRAEGGIARTIFKIIYDASPFTETTPKSILILLDFAGYVEKIHEWLGGYIAPIYIGEPKGLAKTTLHLEFIKKT